MTFMLKCIFEGEEEGGGAIQFLGVWSWFCDKPSLKVHLHSPLDI